MPVQNIMVRNSMVDTRYSVWSTDDCISNVPLQTILAPNTLSCDQRACCNAVYGANSPRQNSCKFAAPPPFAHSFPNTSTTGCSYWS